MRILMLTVLTWSTAVFAADVKIGVVDINQAMLRTKDGQSAKKSLEAEFKKRQETIQAMEAKMRKQSEEFQRKQELLAGDAKAKQQTEMQKELREYQEAVTKNQSEMEKRQRDLIQPIERKMNSIIAEIAKKENLALVISRPEQLVLYAEKEIDLTDRVVAEYDKG